MSASAVRFAAPIAFFVTALVAGWAAVSLYAQTATQYPQFLWTNPVGGPAQIDVFAAGNKIRVDVELRIRRNVEVLEPRSEKSPLFSGEFELSLSNTPDSSLLVVFYGPARAAGIEVLIWDRAGSEPFSSFQRWESDELPAGDGLSQMIRLPAAAEFLITGKFDVAIDAPSGKYVRAKLPTLMPDAGVPSLANAVFAQHQTWNPPASGKRSTKFLRDPFRETFEEIDPEPKYDGPDVTWEASVPLAPSFLLLDHRIEQELEEKLFQASIIGGLAGALAIEFLLHCRSIRKPKAGKQVRPTRSVAHRRSAARRRA